MAGRNIGKLKSIAQIGLAYLWLLFSKQGTNLLLLSRIELEWFPTQMTYRLRKNKL
jgi:hypothetical protein